MISAKGALARTPHQHFTLYRSIREEFEVLSFETCISMTELINYAIERILAEARTNQEEFGERVRKRRIARANGQ